MASKPVRTYGSRTRCAPQLSSPPSTLSSSPPATQRNKRQASSSPCKGGEPPKKRRALGFSSSINTKAKVFVKKTPAKVKPAQKKLTQLHFSVDSSILVSCPRCGLSYTRGAPGDEALHRCHCARVQRGMEWGREEERERGRPGLNLVEVENPVRLTDGRRGRIVCYRADAGGKIGAKTTVLLDTINLTLSAPPLTPAILQDSKIYLLLVSVETSFSAASANTASSLPREKIAGCVVAQRITTAMAIVPPIEQTDLKDATSASSLSVNRTPLPTPLGIPRLFTALAYRRQGVALALLTAAARTAVHGCVLDPRRGEVAFTQPTESGQAVMESWGGGGVRVYEE